MEADVVVIGGGMAGTVAALNAAAKGADVLLIRKGHGATAMSSGAIDIAGPQSFLPLDPWDTIPPIVDILTGILRSNPLHPYSVIAGGRGGHGHLVSAIHHAYEFVVEKIPNLNLEGYDGRNLALPSVLGTVKFSAFAPRSLVGGNLLEMRDARVLLVGINGLTFFQPHTCRQTLGRYSSLHSPLAIAEVDVIEADIPRFMNALPSAPFEIARCLDSSAAVKELAKSVSKGIHAGTTHVAFPPVLGLDNHCEIFETLSRELEPKAFELVSPNFSVPGYRLQGSLEVALRRGGVRVVSSEVVDAKRDGRMVRNLLLGDRKAKRTATGKTYVIAAGKFSTGGLVADDFPREPIFRLPLFSGDRRVDNKFIQDLMSWNVEGKQLFLSCGIHVDNKLRPLDSFGEPAYENLFAAGSIIGEYDYVADKCGLGVALLTGFLAGENAAA